MTIICNRCQVIIKSFLIDKDQAVADLMIQLEKHVGAKHKEAANEFQMQVGKLAILIGGYFFVHQFGLIPDTETHLLSTHNKGIETILKILEVDIDSEEEINNKPVEEEGIKDLTSEQVSP